MNNSNDNTHAHPDYVALACLTTGELRVLAFAVDHRDAGVLYETSERRFGVDLLADGSFRFEAPREARDAAVDLRTILRCGTPDEAAAATALPPAPSMCSPPGSSCDGGHEP